VDQPAAHGAMAGFVDCFCGTHMVAMFNLQVMNGLWPSMPQFESSLSIWEWLESYPFMVMTGGWFKTFF